MTTTLSSVCCYGSGSALAHFAHGHGSQGDMKKIAGDGMSSLSIEKTSHPGNTSLCIFLRLDIKSNALDPSGILQAMAAGRRALVVQIAKVVKQRHARLLAGDAQDQVAFFQIKTVNM